MKLYMISWQQGFGIAFIFYLNKENAEKKVEEIKENIVKYNENPTTGVHYDYSNSLSLKEVNTED